MKLAMREILDERMGGQLNPLAPLAEAIYRLYMCPVATEAPQRRVVILSGAWQHLETSRQVVSTTIGLDAVCQLLWSTLQSAGRRVGEVVYDNAPAAGDYVFYRDGEDYRVALPLREPSAASALAANAA
jgi:hypothetical protein